MQKIFEKNEKLVVVIVCTLNNKNYLEKRRVKNKTLQL